MDGCLRAFYDVTARKPSGWLGKLDRHRFRSIAGVEMLCFVKNLVQGLAQLHRVLEPAASLAFVTAAQPTSWLSRRLSAPWLRCLRFYNDDEVDSMLRGTGFRTVQLERVERSEHTRYAHQIAYAVK